MTQKGSLFKGQQKKKTVPPNRHGKTTQTRKGKRFVKPSKITKDMDLDRVTKTKNTEKGRLFLKDGGSLKRSQSNLALKPELTKFINHCNEVKAATMANKEGGQLSIVKPPVESSATADNKKDKQPETAEA